MTSIDTGDDDPQPAAVPEDGPLARLFAGGRHVRLLLLGRPPPELILPPLDGFERVAKLARASESGGDAIGDPLRLPFTEALFDRALWTTMLPEADARVELRELWRVLAPAGLAVLAVKARRAWELTAPGWRRTLLQPVIEDTMFEVLDWRTETLPDRWHLALVAKADGLRPAMIGRVAAAAAAPVTASSRNRA